MRIRTHAKWRQGKKPCPIIIIQTTTLSSKGFRMSSRRVKIKAPYIGRERISTFSVRLRDRRRQIASVFRGLPLLIVEARRSVDRRALTSVPERSRSAARMLRYRPIRSEQKPKQRNLKSANRKIYNTLKTGRTKSLLSKNRSPNPALKFSNNNRLHQSFTQ